MPDKSFDEILAQTARQNEALEQEVSQGADTGQEGNHAHTNGEPGTETPSLRPLLAFSDLENMPPMKWLIEGIFPADGVGCLYGDPASAKSFLAIDLAAHVAEGTAWFGLPVLQLPVVYVAFEGRGGFPKRAKAWRLFNQREKFPAGVWLDYNPADLLKPADVALMAASYPKGALIIIDTLAQSQSGDENSTKDMGSFNRACCDLKERVGGPLLLIHHRGKDTSKGLRGSSSLLGALDVTIEVTVDKATGIRVWEVAKNKEGEDGQKFAFKLEKVTLEPDNFDSDTSCAVVPCEANAAQVSAEKTLTGNSKLAYDCFIKILQHKEKSGYGVQLEEWRKAFYERHPGENDGSHRAAFYKARTALIEKEILFKNEQEIYYLQGVTPETLPLPEGPQPGEEQGELTGQEEKTEIAETDTAAGQEKEILKKAAVTA